MLAWLWLRSKNRDSKHQEKDVQNPQDDFELDIARELKELSLAGFDEAEAASYALKRTVRDNGNLDVDIQQLRDLSYGNTGTTSSRRRALLCKLFSCSDTLVLSFALHRRHTPHQAAQTDKSTDALPPAAPLSLEHVAADFGTFFDSSDDIAEHLHHLLSQTLRKELPWLSTQAQAHTLGILLLLPHIQEVALYDEILLPLLDLFRTARDVHVQLLELISAAPQVVTINIVFALQQFLTLRLYSQSTTDVASITAVHLLAVVHSANAVSAHPAASRIFHNDVINSQDFNLQQDWLRGNMHAMQSLHGASHPVHGVFSFSHFPFLYGPAAKARLLRFQVAHDTMQSLNSGPGAMPLISMQLGGAVGSTPMLGSLLALSLPTLLGGSGPLGRRRGLTGTAMGSAAAGQHLLLHVRRGPELLQDALTQIRAAMHTDQSQEQSSALRRPLRVKFADEQGVDEGGPSREFLQLVVRECFSPNFGMFQSDPDARTFCMRASHIHQMLDEFELIGVIVGLAIHNGHTLNLNLAPAIFRKLLRAPLRLEDLCDVHPDIHRSLCLLLEYPADSIEADMGLSFQVSHEVDFEVTNHDLIPDGASVAVTAANRDDFVREYIDFLLVQRIAPQFDAFARGFYRVCDRSMMNMFESCPSELEEVVCGTQTRDFEELKRSTVYEGNAVNGDADFIKWFWEVVLSFGETKQRQLLQFVTGNDRAPVGGLGSLVPQFKIVKNGEHSNRLPTAHVCFNILLLPEYESKEWLADRLEKAIEHDQGFGLA